MTLDHPIQPTSPESTPVQSPTPAPNHSLTWLWPGRIPSGKLTLLDGSPNCGTTLFALTLAAHVSSGTPWPDGTPCEQGTVLFLAPHDHYHDTLLPRLKAAGAHHERILSLSHIPETAQNAPARVRPLSFPRDLPLLEQVITTRHTSLLILDPYSAFPGWRRAIPALIDLAQRTHCAILLTRSLSRPPADPLHPRCPASTVLTAARSHLLLTPDPRDERHCLMLTPKHSLCAAPSILAYHITSTDQDLPFLTWLPVPDPTHLQRLCTGPIRSPHRLAILQFLRECPKPCPIKAILAATCYDYEPGRKMLLRMSQAGELVALGHGRYTTAHRPCLANSTTDSPSPSPAAAHAVTPVPPSSEQRPPSRAPHLVRPSSLQRPPTAASTPHLALFKRMFDLGPEAFSTFLERLATDDSFMPTISRYNALGSTPSHRSELVDVPAPNSSHHPHTTTTPTTQNNTESVPNVPVNDEDHSPYI